MVLWICNKYVTIVFEKVSQIGYIILQIVALYLRRFASLTRFASSNRGFARNEANLRFDEVNPDGELFIWIAALRSQ